MNDDKNDKNVHFVYLNRTMITLNISKAYQKSGLNMPRVGYERSRIQVLVGLNESRMGHTRQKI